MSIRAVRIRSAELRKTRFFLNRINARIRHSISATMGPLESVKICIMNKMTPDPRTKFLIHALFSL